VSFVTGSHVGEMIIWDILDWTVQACECSFWDPSPQLDTQQEIKLCQKPDDISIHHFTWDEENVFAAVGRGLYVYNLHMKRVIACQKSAHDSNVLHIAKLPNRYTVPSVLQQMKETHISQRHQGNFSSGKAHLAPWFDLVGSFGNGEYPWLSLTEEFVAKC